MQRAPQPATSPRNPEFNEHLQPGFRPDLKPYPMEAKSHTEYGDYLPGSADFLRAPALTLLPPYLLPSKRPSPTTHFTPAPSLMSMATSSTPAHLASPLTTAGAPLSSFFLRSNFQISVGTMFAHQSIPSTFFSLIPQKKHSKLHLSLFLVQLLSARNPPSALRPPSHLPKPLQAAKLSLLSAKPCPPNLTNTSLITPALCPPKTVKLRPPLPKS
jgi:hypothetical protein